MRTASYDEMVDSTGKVRDHWAQVARVIGGLGADGLARRAREVERLLEADGVTYHAPGGPAGPTTRWALDAVPVPIASDTWASVERGVIQRAELLDLLLGDLYGERRLVARGIVPAELVFAHPGFLRELDGVRLPGAHQLFTYAVDLVRTADGGFAVLADRTQAPSGAGYALENRVVVSRVFPSLYRDASVHRLAPFFRTLRSSLQRVAPAGVDDPRIVVLSPGPWSETAFEHAYLASYLGYPLVEGSDLVVRDGRLWMHALGGLEPVHVVLRRVDAAWCDPLELRPDSFLGVPGLVEACRRGTVSVVNTLGSAVLENPGLLPVLPAVAKELLGQTLHLPSVETFWCGERAARSHVLANLDQLVIKPIGRSAGPLARFGWEATAAELDDLRRQIEARPYAWVGQQPASFGTVPTATPDGLQPRPAVLRSFAVSNADSYSVMPGALTRVGADADVLRISNQNGAVSKDTWVLASEPELLTGFWLHEGPPVAALEPSSISPRAAENLFWLGRYAERAEAVVRLLRVVYDRRTDFQHGVNPAGTACLHELLRALTEVTGTYPGFVGDGAGDRLDAPGGELLALVADAKREGSLAHAVRHMLDAASAVRDQLSLDTWLVVGALDSDLLHLPAEFDDRQLVAQGTLRRVLQSLLALGGLAAESLVRDPGWRFMDAGRRLERAMQLLSLLRATITQVGGVAVDSLVIESVLTAAESIVTYRRRYRSQAQVETVLDLLVVDPGNPRSVQYQLDRLAEDLAQLPAGPHERLDAAERSLVRAATAVRLADTQSLSLADGDGHRGALVAFLDETLALLRDTSDQVRALHFPAPVPLRAYG